jgi:hypothetical protein
LPLEEHVQFIVLYLHYVRTFAVDQHDSVAEIWMARKVPLQRAGSSKSISNSENMMHSLMR